METTTATVETVTAVRLSCNHSLTGNDLFSLTGSETKVGAKVPCPKCPARLSGAAAVRRVRTVVTSVPTEVEAPAAAPVDEAPVVDDPAPEAPAPTADAPQAVDPADRVALHNAAKAEHAALTAWNAGGQQGPRPATPNLDLLNDAHAAGVRPRARRSGKGRQVSDLRRQTLDAMKAKGTGGRTQTRVRDDAELQQRVANLRAEHPEASSKELRDFGLWVLELSYSYARWDRAWAAVDAAQDGDSDS